MRRSASTSQHGTEAEPDTFALGSTIVAVRFESMAKEEARLRAQENNLRVKAETARKEAENNLQEAEHQKHREQMLGCSGGIGRWHRWDERQRIIGAEKLEGAVAERVEFGMVVVVIAQSNPRHCLSRRVQTLCSSRRSARSSDAPLPPQTRGT